MSSSTMVVEFNSLPDNCILLIFDKLTLSELLAVELVCTKWQRIQRKACQGRTDVMLLVGKKALDNKNRDFDYPTRFAEKVRNDDGTVALYTNRAREEKWLGVKCNTLPTADYLLAKFPNITSLQISVCFSFLLELISILNTTGLSSKLTTLKLWLWSQEGSFYFTPLDRQRTFILFDSINSLNSLKHLTIHAKLELLDSFQNHDGSRALFPILSQLEEFNFTSFDGCELLIDSLLNYAQSNTRLRQIGLMKPLDLEQQPKLASLSADLRGKVTRLFTTDPYPYTIPSLVNLFPSLTSFSFSFGDRMTYSDVITSLGPLHQLTDLTIRFRQKSQRGGHPFRTLTILDSVKVLIVRFEGNNIHDWLAELNILLTFPNLQLLTIGIKGRRCTACNCIYTEGMSKRSRECVAIMVEPFKQLQKLRKIDIQFDVNDSGIEFAIAGSARFLSSGKFHTQMWKDD